MTADTQGTAGTRDRFLLMEERGRQLERQAIADEMCRRAQEADEPEAEWLAKWAARLRANTYLEAE